MNNSQTPSIDSKFSGANGKQYTVKSIANVTGNPGLTPPTVVFEDSDGGVFTRPVRSWFSNMTQVS